MRDVLGCTVVLDALQVGIAVFGHERWGDFENLGFARLALDDPSVRATAEEVARDVSALTPSEDAADSSAVTVTRDLETAAGRLRVLGQRLSGDSSTPQRGDTILVLVQNVTTDFLSERLLQKQFALTAREARVAALLARGSSNKQIASRLGISLHTARHHVEHVLIKLQVRKRAEVPARILGLVSDPD